MEDKGDLGVDSSMSIPKAGPLVDSPNLQTVIEKQKKKVAKDMSGQS